MTRDITRSSGGALTEAPKLSPELQKILQRRKVVTSYGGDDGMAAGGAEFRDGVWDAPEWVDARERDEARKAHAAFEMQLRPVTAERVREFLLFLWNSTKHPNDTNWEAVAAVYPMMLDGHPSWCFRPERLKLAAQTAFDWFPSVRQLAEFMEPDRQAILERVKNLETVARSPTERQAGGSAAGRGEFKWSKEAADAHGQRLREKANLEREELVEIMRKRDEEAGRPPANMAVPPRATGEDDKAYVARLVAYTRDQISLGAKARRADEERYRRAAELDEAAKKPVSRPKTPPPTGEQTRAAYGATGIKPKDVREPAGAEVPS